MNQYAMLLITSMNKLVAKKKHSKLQFRKPIFHTRSQKAEKVRGRNNICFITLCCIRPLFFRQYLVSARGSLLARRRLPLSFSKNGQRTYSAWLLKDLLNHCLKCKNLVSHISVIKSTIREVKCIGVAIAPEYSSVKFVFNSLDLRIFRKRFIKFIQESINLDI